MCYSFKVTQERVIAKECLENDECEVDPSHESQVVE